MRISTALTFQINSENLVNQQSKLNRIQMQLASGKRLLSASDDVKGATDSIQLERFIATSSQYKSNIGSANNRLSEEESALGHAGDALQQLRELAVQGNNATLKSDDRKVLADQALHVLNGLMETANTMSSNGEYVFGGNNSQTKPFTQTGTPPTATFSWQGQISPPIANEQRLVQIADTRYIAQGDSGNHVFGNLTTSEGSGDTVFNIAQRFYANMVNNTPSDKDIGDITVALEHMSDVRATVGDRLNVLDTQNDIHDGSILQMKDALSNIQEIDYTEAIGRFTLQETVLQAAQQSFVKVKGLSLFNYLG